MKKTLYRIAFLAGVITFFGSCNKTLDKSPQDQISDPQFWKSDQDLQLYVNGLYTVLPTWNTTGSGGNPLLDASTDVSIAAGLWLPTKNLLDGVVNVPASGGGWDWTNVRNVNYFLQNSNRVPDGGMKKQYIGEAYFFRAWNYFVLLRQFGDLPIITKTIDPSKPEDQQILYGPRSSRTDVVNFMIGDLDSAIANMDIKSNLPAGRINKDVAYLFEARVCLYEGTWEKYHQNDAFKGSTNGNAFLTKAAAAAKAVIDGGRYSLAVGNPNQVYYNLFNQLDYGNNPEVMLWRGYNQQSFGGNFGNELWNWPNGSGITKDMMDMYLCTDGLPISVSPLYQGDNDIRVIIMNRDPRCVQSVMNPGDPVTIGVKNDTTFYKTPGLSSSTNSVTGYESQKFRRPQVDPATGTYSYNQAYIVFRYAEALLIYAEAQAELGLLNQSDLDMSINKLRDRVGMPHMLMGSITTDPKWPNYGYALPAYLYEIRREREVELLNEGFRFDDLMRWRADQLFVGVRPKGAYYSNELKAVNPNLAHDANNYLDPYLSVLKGANGGWGFNPAKNYLKPLPTNDLTLNSALKQNPGW